MQERVGNKITVRNDCPLGYARPKGVETNEEMEEVETIKKKRLCELRFLCREVKPVLQLAIGASGGRTMLYGSTVWFGVLLPVIASCVRSTVRSTTNTCSRPSGAPVIHHPSAGTEAGLFVLVQSQPTRNGVPCAWVWAWVRPADGCIKWVSSAQSRNGCPKRARMERQGLACGGRTSQNNKWNEYILWMGEPWVYLFMMVVIFAPRHLIKVRQALSRAQLNLHPVRRSGYAMHVQSQPQYFGLDGIVLIKCALSPSRPNMP